MRASGTGSGGLAEQRWCRSPFLTAAAACFFLAVLTFATFRPILHNDFIDWDDREVIADNPDFSPPRLDALAHYWTKPFRGLYIPLTYTAWGLIASIASRSGGSGPLDPTAFHVASVAVHALASILVFFLVRRVVRSGLAAWFGAAVFAVHPLQVEAVAWMTSFYTVLGGCLSLAALYAYVVFADWRDDAHRPLATWSMYALATLFFVAALLAKPSSVVVPLLGLALQPLQRRPLRPALIPLGTWLLLAVPITWITHSAQSAAAVFTTNWPMRLVLAFDSPAFYLHKLVLPIHLIPDYGRSPRWAQSHPLALLDVCVPLVVLTAGWAWRRRFRWLLPTMAISALSLLPVLGLVPFSFQRYSTVADRYFYLGMLGPAMLVGYLLAKPRTVMLVAATAVVLICASLSHAQSENWHDSKTLFDYTLSVNPHSLAADYVLGKITAAAGFQEAAAAKSPAELSAADARLYQAIQYDSQALRTDPTFSEVLFNLANLYERTGHLEAAVDTYERAVHGQAATAQQWNNLGIALTQLGRADEAQNAFATALRIDPQYADAEADWGLLLVAMGDAEGASKHFHRALSLRPDCAAALHGLEALRQIQGSP
jgi:tetratricopeptide (TPR) repeat protein